VCFSPQADVGGGLVICAIGIDAVRHVRRRREFLALAWIPLLPGAHQVHRSARLAVAPGPCAAGDRHVALWAYLLVAFVMLPVFIPLAVIAVEPTRRRKLTMVPFAATGTVIAVILFAAMARGLVPVAPLSDTCQDCPNGPDCQATLVACLTCGWVACFDDSPNRHARAHYEETDPPVAASLVPGAAWRWCHVHQRLL
jgi:hypothetical protein